MNYNKVIIGGRMTRDPQLSYLPSKTAVVEFSVATSRKYKKQDGSEGEEACFTDCQMFGKRAEVVNKYFKKGDPILIDGRLKLDQWQAQDGSKRSKLRVFVENFEFVQGTKKQDDQEQQPEQNQSFNEKYDLPADDPNPF